MNELQNSTNTTMNIKVKEDLVLKSWANKPSQADIHHLVLGFTIIATIIQESGDLSLAEWDCYGLLRMKTDYIVNLQV